MVVKKQEREEPESITVDQGILIYSSLFLILPERNTTFENTVVIVILGHYNLLYPKKGE